VAHPVEELLQVEVHDDPVTRGEVLLRRAHRLMGRASGPEPVARRREGRVPGRLQHLQRRLLDEAVEHRRHAERP
jgi:hypothetical protein